MAYKVFTNGSTLQASELNENLMQQAVATFSNASARTAAITSPVEGQMTYLEDVDRYDHWNGTSWVSPFGMTFLNRTSFTSQASISISNVFSTTYDNYLIAVNMLQTSVANNEVRLRLRTSAGDDSSGIYNGGYNALDNSGGTTIRSGGYSLSYAPLTTNAYDTVPIKFNLFFNGPINARKTFSGIVNAGNLGVAGFGTTGSAIESTSTHTGFTIYSSAGGTYTGSITVYGLRK